ncbi:MAG: AsnC family protein [Candidatus Thorarchaeota archaeon]|jgi:DNA-binding Lrp family transcriptional regulator
MNENSTLSVERNEENHQDEGDASHKMTSSNGNPLDIQTPYDDSIPSSQEPSVQFYIDAMRIYLGLYEGSISMEDAVHASEKLKENPEFIKHPINPTIIPLNETFKEKMLSNLLTLRKFNLLTKDSVKSAYSFALLSPTTPVNTTDYKLLQILEKDPLSTLVDASAEIGVTPRTVARSIERLEKNFVFRVSALMDMTAFGAQPFILFFTLAEGIEWDMVEDGFALYPFTKSILKTSMADLGYVSFLVPGLNDNLITFTEYINDISAILFEYSNLHAQQGIGANTNLSLLRDNVWNIPESVNRIAEDVPAETNTQVRVLKCKGWLPGLTEDDFKIISYYRSSLRDPPRVLVDRIRMQGMDVDTRQVSQSIRKSIDRELIHPFTDFRGIGLSTNFCFEIICDEIWRDRILRAIVNLPAVNYYLSQLGIILWAQVPGEQQVEYYQHFRALESHKGIKSVNPIMTINLKGSRSELDMIKEWKFGSNGWTVNRRQLSLEGYFDV